MIRAHLGRIRSVWPIAPENKFRNATERDRANNCHGASPSPSGWSKRQKSKPIPQGGKSAKDEKRPREKAVNSAAAECVEQTHYTHESERRRPQDGFQSRRFAEPEREGTQRYAPEKKRTRCSA